MRPWIGFPPLGCESYLSLGGLGLRCKRGSKESGDAALGPSGERQAAKGLGRLQRELCLSRSLGNSSAPGNWPALPCSALPWVARLLSRSPCMTLLSLPELGAVTGKCCQWQSCSEFGREENATMRHPGAKEDHAGG